MLLLLLVVLHHATSVDMEEWLLCSSNWQRIGERLQMQKMTQYPPPRTCAPRNEIAWVAWGVAWGQLRVKRSSAALSPLFSVR